MEARDYLRPLIAGLVAIGVVILIIVLIVKLFTHHGAPSSQPVDVGSYANTEASATLLIDSPTNIDQDHRQVKIIVSRDQNEIDVIKGYEGQVIDRHTYANNSAAFGAFLQSLKLLNYSSGTNTPSDYRGYCPQGDRYVYSFNDGTDNLFSYWSTSCNQGTFKGSASNVRDLFIAQIPTTDFDDITSNDQNIVL